MDADKARAASQGDVCMCMYLSWGLDCSIEVIANEIVYYSYGMVSYRFATLSLRSGWLRPLINLISFAISADMLKEGRGEGKTPGAAPAG